MDDERDAQPSTAANDDQADAMDVDLQLQHEVVAVQVDTELHLLVELTMPPAPVDDTRRPLRLAVVVDRSGSMRGARLAAAKASADYLVEQLQPDDQLALVTYDDEARLLVPLAPIDTATLHTAIGSIRTGGTTNLSGGWLKGAQELRKATDGITRILLLSDGHANRGIIDPDRLHDVAGSLGAVGIATTTIGVGDGFDEHLMSAIADASRGSAHFAETPDDAPGIFAQEFDDLVSVTAQNVTVEITPSRDVEVVGVLNTFPCLPTPTGVQVEVGDAYAGQTMRVVCKLRIPAVDTLGLANVGDVTVRWIGVHEQVTEHAVTHPLVVNAVSADDAANASPNATVVEEAIILEAGRAAARARALADRGRFDEARELVERTRRSLEGLPDHHVDLPMVRDSMERIQASVAAMDAGSWEAVDAKRLHYESRKLRSRKRRPDA